MSPPPTSRSQRGYDRLAAVYHPIEWLAYGGRLQRARTALIDELRPWKRMLILGDGDGRLLARLIAKQMHHAEQSDHSDGQPPQRAAWSITSVDQSTQMLGRQRSRVEAYNTSGCVEYIQTDARRYEPETDAYDVIVTPFFLDCFSPAVLDVCLPKWLTGLRPGGMLYHVDFVVPQSAWQRLRARPFLWAMHVFFRWQTGLENRQLVDTAAAIERCGLRKVTEHVCGGGMIATQIWCDDSDQVSIKSSGARIGS